jgi:hypothetical protein
MRITDYARDFADVIERMAEQLKKSSRSQAPQKHHATTGRDHRLKNEGDDIYHAAIAELFHDHMMRCSC